MECLYDYVWLESGQTIDTGDDVERHPQVSRRDLDCENEYEYVLLSEDETLDERKEQSRLKMNEDYSQGTEIYPQHHGKDCLDEKRRGVTDNERLCLDVNNNSYNLEKNIRNQDGNNSVLGLCLTGRYNVWQNGGLATDDKQRSIQSTKEEICSSETSHMVNNIAEENTKDDNRNVEKTNTDRSNTQMTKVKLLKRNENFSAESDRRNWHVKKMTVGNDNQCFDNRMNSKTDTTQATNETPQDYIQFDLISLEMDESEYCLRKTPENNVTYSGQLRGKRRKKPKPRMNVRIGNGKHILKNTSHPRKRHTENKIQPGLTHERKMKTNDLSHFRSKGSKQEKTYHIKGGKAATFAFPKSNLNGGNTETANPSRNRLKTSKNIVKSKLNRSASKKLTEKQMKSLDTSKSCLSGHASEKRNPYHLKYAKKLSKTGEESHKSKQLMHERVHAGKRPTKNRSFVIKGSSSLLPDVHSIGNVFEENGEIMEENCDPDKIRDNYNKPDKVVSFKRVYMRRNSQKVEVCRKDGTRRIILKFPCKFCGELFSRGHLWRHEQSHGNEKGKNPVEVMVTKQDAVDKPSEIDEANTEKQKTEDENHAVIQGQKSKGAIELHMCDENDHSLKTSGITLKYRRNSRKFKGSKNIRKQFSKTYTHVGSSVEELQVCNVKTNSQKMKLKQHVKRIQLGKEYSCELCAYSSRSKGFLRMHCKMHETCAKTVTCKCGVAFRNRLAMWQWHKRKDLRCGVQSTCPSNDSVIKEMENNNDDNEVGQSKQNTEHNEIMNTLENINSPTIISNDDLSETVVDEHMETVNVKGKQLEKRYSCKMCTYSSRSKGFLRMHCKMHETCAKPVTCKCGVAFRNRLAMWQWHKRKDLKCGVQSTSPSNDSVIKEMENNNDDNEVGQSKKNTEHYEIMDSIENMRSPTRCTSDELSEKTTEETVIIKGKQLEKKYSCKICRYSSRSKGFLRMHCKMHETCAKPVTCKCGVAFRNRLAMWQWHKRKDLRCGVQSTSLSNDFVIEEMENTNDDNEVGQSKKYTEHNEIMDSIENMRSPTRCTSDDLSEKTTDKQMETVNVKGKQLEKKYSCKICKYSSRSKGFLRMHCKMHETCSKLVTCKCGVAFRNRLAMWQWHKRKDLRCGVQSTSPSNDSVIEEMENTNDDKEVGQSKQNTEYNEIMDSIENMHSPTRCTSDELSEKTTDEQMETVNVKGKQLEKKYTCKICKYSSRSKGFLRMHCKMHETCAKTVTCKCGITFCNKFAMRQWHFRKNIKCAVQQIGLTGSDDSQSTIEKTKPIPSKLNDSSEKTISALENSNPVFKNASATKYMSSKIQYKQRLTFPKKGNLVREKISCKICAYSSRSKAFFEKHCKMHETCSKTVTCECGIMFRNKFTLRQWHMQKKLTCAVKETNLSENATGETTNKINVGSKDKEELSAIIEFPEEIRVSTDDKKRKHRRKKLKCGIQPAKSSVDFMNNTPCEKNITDKIVEHNDLFENTEDEEVITSVTVPLKESNVCDTDEIEGEVVETNRYAAEKAKSIKDMPRELHDYDMTTCEKKTPTADTVKKKKLENEYMYSCQICKYSSRSKGFLRLHCKMHETCAKTVTCKCGITFRNKLTMRQWHRRNDLRCDLKLKKSSDKRKTNKSSVVLTTENNRPQFAIGQQNNCTNVKNTCYNKPLATASTTEGTTRNNRTETKSCIIDKTTVRKLLKRPTTADKDETVDIPPDVQTFRNTCTRSKIETSQGETYHGKGTSLSLSSYVESKPFEAEKTMHSSDMSKWQFSCNKCRYSTNLKRIMHRHLKVHRSRKTITCKCSIDFLTKYAMFQWHKRNNVICGSMLPRKAGAYDIGSNERNYSISIDNPTTCWKKQDSLEVWVKPRTKIRSRQKCKKCNYRFNTHQNWRNHEQLHINNTGYSCKECSITMKSKQSLAVWHYQHHKHHCKIQEKKMIRKKKVCAHKQICEDGKSTVELNTNTILSPAGCVVTNGNKEVFDRTEKLGGITDSSCLTEEQGVFTSVKVSENYTGQNSSSHSRKKVQRSLKEMTMKFKGIAIGKTMTRLETQHERLDFNQAYPDKIVNSEQYALYKMASENVPNCFNLQDTTHKLQHNETSALMQIPNHREEPSIDNDKQIYPVSKKLSLKNGELVFHPIKDKVEVFEKEVDRSSRYKKIGTVDSRTLIQQNKQDVLSRDCFHAETGNISQNNMYTTTSDSTSNENTCLENVDTSGPWENCHRPCSAIEMSNVDFQVQRNNDKGHSTNFKKSLYSVNMDDGDFIDEERSLCYIVDSNTRMTANNGHAPVLQSIRRDMCTCSFSSTDNFNRHDLLYETFTQAQLAKNVNISNSVAAQRTLIAGSSVQRNTFGDASLKPIDPDVNVLTNVDNELFYASKFQTQSDCSRCTRLPDCGQLGSSRSKHMEDLLFDTGETDENNNTEKRGSNLTNSRVQEENAQVVGNVQNANFGQREGRGNGDDDDQGNNDRNYNSANCVNDIQSVELLPCLVCQETFNDKTELMRHLTRIHRLTNLCQICYFDECEIRRFANPVSLRNHKVRDHPEDMVKCVCGAMLIDNKMLSCHLKKFRCNTCQTGGGTEQMAKCICGKRFASQEMLLNHRSKCRKRHCLNETCAELVETPKRIDESPKSMAVADNRNEETTNRLLRPRPVDLNNNTSTLDTWRTDSGRTSRIRKCRENVSYSERKYDRLFETAVNLSKSGRKSLDASSHPNRYLQFPYPANSNASTDEVLDLRVKTARDRSSTTCFEKENFEYFQNDAINRCYEQVNSDMNGNSSVLLSSRRKSIKGKHGGSGANKSSSVNVRGNPRSRKLNLGSSCLKEKAFPKNNDESRQTCLASSSETRKVNRRSQKNQAKPIGSQKYPYCRKCRQWFTKAGLDIHRRFVHSRNRLSPTPAEDKCTGITVRYRCRWCRHVSLHWGTAVRHHYKNHQREELDLITLNMPAKC